MSTQASNSAPAGALTTSRAHTDRLIRARGSAHANDLARTLNRALDLARALDGDHASDLVNYLASALDRTDNLRRALVNASDLANALDLARDLARDLDSNLADVYSRASDFGADLDSSLASALIVANTHASDLAAGLDSDQALDRDSGREHLEREVRRVAPPAARLLTTVARLLPATDRARYDEEFKSELWDLAQTGAGRLRQVAYALRQLRCARLMVSALRSPRRRGAAP